MQARQVSYGRKVSDGNYGSIVFDVAVILEEGESEDQAAEYLVGKVNGLLEDVRAREKAWEEAERKRDEPWRVTPDMVADQPTFRARAIKAAQLRAEHNTTERAADVRQRAIDRLGVDTEWTLQADGSFRADIEGMVVTFRYNDFHFEVPMPGEEKPRLLQYIHSLPELGEALAKMEGKVSGVDPDEPPF